MKRGRENWMNDGERTTKGEYKIMGGKMFKNCKDLWWRMKRALESFTKISAWFMWKNFNGAIVQYGKRDQWLLVNDKRVSGTLTDVELTRRIGAINAGLSATMTAVKTLLVAGKDASARTGRICHRLSSVFAVTMNVSSSGCFWAATECCWVW